MKTAKLSQAQRNRLQDFAENEACKVVGWSFEWSGPIVRTPTGALVIITRDGGLEAARPRAAA